MKPTREQAAENLENYQIHSSGNRELKPDPLCAGMGAEALRTLKIYESRTYTALKSLHNLVEHLEAHDADDEDAHNLAEDLRTVMRIIEPGVTDEAPNPQRP